MSDQQVAAVVTLASDAAVLAVFIWMPVARGERAFFGVRVDAETYRGEGRRVLRRYWLTLSAVFVLAGALGYYFSAGLGMPLAATFTMLGSTGAASFIYAAYARRLRPFAVADVRTRFASSVRARRLEDYTRAWVEASVVLLTLGAFFVLAHFYPRLPERIPVHFNASGEADDWARRSLSSAFFLPALGAYLQTVFFVLKRDLVRAKMTLPASKTEEYLRGKERFLSANMSLIDCARMGVAALFFTITMLTVSNAVPELGRFKAAADAAAFTAVVLMLGGIFYFIWRMAAINGEIERATGDEYVQRSEDEGRWRHGGLTYYNPEDPALVVEKLVGLGYTLNLAHPSVRRRLALLAGVPLFVLWAVLSL